MESMTATYLHGTAILAEHPRAVEVQLGFGISAQGGVAKATGAALTGDVAGIALTSMCAAPLAQSAQAACTGTVVFGGGSFTAETGTPVVIADAKPNFRTEKLPRDRQPV